MTVTIYKPQKCVCSMLDPFVTVISDNGNYVKVFEVELLLQTGNTLLIGSGKEQAFIDTRLFTYYDVI